MNYRVVGGKALKGEVTTNISKNAAVGLLCASLLNRGTTTLKRMPRIEELKRLIEVMESIGVGVKWQDNGPVKDGEPSHGAGDMIITPPQQIDLSGINRASAERTRSIAMFIPALVHRLSSNELGTSGSFELPAPGGCDLGKRSLGAHIDALARLGIYITASADKKSYHIEAADLRPAEIVMYEASDTGVENVLMAAALIPGVTTIKFASANYMVQDLCVFLESCGVRIEGIGTSTLVVHGVDRIEGDITGYPSEDPIESMFFISLAATTRSEIVVKRCPIDFLELELYTLAQMGLRYKRSAPYVAENGRTVLVDLTMKPSDLVAPPEKIAPRPYPGINIDNLPFFVPVATQATGRTLIHDWVYEGRAVHYMEMKKLGADMVLADPHRVFVTGPTPLKAAIIEAPPALRPATILLIGMLAAQGESELKNVYPISRGYENLHERLRAIGASIEAVE
ncbi:UDP-N-acetylglucosamine 1-carboxyvinyltransferase [Candidatus Kaiserbacteria bacterium]|nr:UDP-N-acetylglucosamine 1-carboxyvinyltransferase [Candidatus Kaiserbacteria bacterium]